MFQIGPFGTTLCPFAMLPVTVAASYSTRGTRTALASSGNVVVAMSAWSGLRVWDVDALQKAAVVYPWDQCCDDPVGPMMRHEETLRLFIFGRSSSYQCFMSAAFWPQRQGGFVLAAFDYDAQLHVFMWTADPLTSRPSHRRSPGMLPVLKEVKRQLGGPVFDLYGLSFSDDCKYMACTCACNGLTYLVIVLNMSTECPFQPLHCAWFVHCVVPLASFLYQPPRVTFRDGTHTLYTVVPSDSVQQVRVYAIHADPDRVECIGSTDLAIAGPSSLVVPLPDTWEYVHVRSAVYGGYVVVQSEHGGVRRQDQAGLREVESLAYVPGVGTVAADRIGNSIGQLVVINGFHASALRMAWVCSVVRFAGSRRHRRRHVSQDC